MLLKDLREMTSRWRGSHIGIQRDGVVKPFYVEEFRRSDNIDIPHIVGRYPGKDLSEITATGLVFNKPKLGMINFMNTTVYVTNLPLRQYRRGLMTGSLKTVNPFTRELKITHTVFPRKFVDSADFMAEMFNPSYPSVHECIGMIRGHSRIAVAFNNKYAIGIKSGYKSPRVFYKGHNIGRLDKDDTVHLRSSATHLLEELSQYLQCILVRKKA